MNKLKRWLADRLGYPQYNTPEELMEACGLPDSGANLPTLPCQHCGRQMIWIKHKGISSICPECCLKWLRESQEEVKLLRTELRDFIDDTVGSGSQRIGDARRKAIRTLSTLGKE